MVEFKDGAVKAQLGTPDMRLPIAYALACSTRPWDRVAPRLSLADMAALTFEEPDTERFPCLTLARYALDTGGNAACVINAANEVAVEAFLHDAIPFTAIYSTVTDTLGRIAHIDSPTLDDLRATNAEARAIAIQSIKRYDTIHSTKH
ncbi:1-deoxy-D-xylulose 5-phosphate reductoisomerase [Prevotella sp. CAG:873]|nr:1-deoxy-D-xylulose 5-phosphate reductoisomerase [Prevotella sp. CAG:873]